MNIRVIGVVSISLILCGCFGAEENVHNYVGNIKKSAKGGVEKLPTITLTGDVSYVGGRLRSPFAKTTRFAAQVEKTDVANLDDSRQKELLENFPLDSLIMKGIISSNDIVWALIQDSSGSLHKIQQGNRIGQNSGVVVKITPTKISIVEKLRDGAGGYFEQQKYLKLQGQNSTED